VLLQPHFEDAAQYEAFEYGFQCTVANRTWYQQYNAVANADTSLVLTGTGDVLEPEDGLIGIGSGGNYALSAAKALIDRDDMDAEAIARKAMEIAAEICVYTNGNLTIESVDE